MTARELQIGESLAAERLAFAALVPRVLQPTEAYGVYMVHGTLQLASGISVDIPAGSPKSRRFDDARQ